MTKEAKALDFSLGGADLEPLDGAHTRDSSIVGRLFRDRGRRVRYFLSFRLRDQEDGQEASQEVFLKLWRHEKAGHLRDDATNYMYSATQSIAADADRHRARHPREQPADDSLSEAPSTAPDLADVLHWRRAMVRFVDILNTLPEETCQVLVLYHLKGMNYDQIAVHLGISRRTVERNMARAIASCRERMKDYL